MSWSRVLRLLLLFHLHLHHRLFGLITVHLEEAWPDHFLLPLACVLGYNLIVEVAELSLGIQLVEQVALGFVGQHGPGDEVRNETVLLQVVDVGDEDADPEALVGVVGDGDGAEELDNRDGLLEVNDLGLNDHLVLGAVLDVLSDLFLIVVVRVLVVDRVGLFDLH